MLVKPLVRPGQIEENMNPGNVLNLSENPQTVALAGAYTYLGPELVAGDIFRTLVAGGVSDILPTAQQLIDALRGNINILTPPANELYGFQANRVVIPAWPANLQPIDPGSSFRRMIVSTTAQIITMTVAASSGITLAAAPYNVTAIAASTWREFLFMIKNSSPQTSLVVNQTNASLVLTVPAATLPLINNITPGMSIFGTNIAALATVTAVNRDTGTITMSLAATATLAGNAVTFTPTVVVAGLRSGTL